MLGHAEDEDRGGGLLPRRAGQDLRRPGAPGTGRTRQGGSPDMLRRLPGGPQRRRPRVHERAGQVQGARHLSSVLQRRGKGARADAVHRREPRGEQLPVGALLRRLRRPRRLLPRAQRRGQVWRPTHRRLERNLQGKRLPQRTLRTAAVYPRRRGQERVPRQAVRRREAQVRRRATRRVPIARLAARHQQVRRPGGAHPQETILGRRTER